MNKRTIKTIIIMGISSVIGYFITLILTSYITENIGIEAFGFVSIAKTFVNYGSILTIALTSFIVRYIVIHYHKDEIEEAKSYYVSSINASLVLCFILAVIFSVIVLKLEFIINIPDYLVHSVKLLFIVVLMSFIVTTITIPFSIGYYIKNRLDISGIVKIISYLGEGATLIILFRFFKPSVWFVGIGSLTAALILLIGAYVTNKIFVPAFHYNKKLHSNKKVKTLLGNGIWNSINHLGNVLNSGLDLLVSNALLTGIQTGQVAVAKSIGAIFSTLSSIIFQPQQPELLKKYSKGVNDNFLNQLKESMILCGFFGCMAFAGFLSIGKEFYKLWLPSQDCDVLYILTVLTVFTYIMDIFLQPIYYVSTLTVKNKYPCFITILGGLINVVGMYFLITNTSLGVYSVPITTMVIMFSINFLFNPIYASWCLKINKRYFYPLILKYLSITFLISIVSKCIATILHPANWIGLIVCAILIVIVGGIIYFVGVLSKDQKTQCINLIKNRF